MHIALVNRRGPVAGGGNPEGILFESDWSTATGNSLNALTDGSTFNVTTNTDTDYLSVVSASGLDFPAGMTNVLRVRRNGDGNSTDVRAQGLWEVPAIGEKLFYRIYLRNEISNAEGDQNISNHAVQFVDGSASFEFNIWVDSWADGTQRFRWNNANASPNHRFRPGSGAEARIPKFTTYRLEWMQERVGVSECVQDIRAYNSAGTLVYDRTNLYNGNGTTTLDSYLTGGGAMTITASNLDKIQIGSSGGAWTFTTDQFYYWGGFMVRSDDWCGAY